MAWPRSVDGRKHYADSALVDEEGEVIAIANALWIELKDPALVAQVKGGA